MTLDQLVLGRASAVLEVGFLFSLVESKALSLLEPSKKKTTLVIVVKWGLALAAASSSTPSFCKGRPHNDDVLVEVAVRVRPLAAVLLLLPVVLLCVQYSTMLAFSSSKGSLLPLLLVVLMHSRLLYSCF